ncbi:hypothetical protein QEH52_00120 [Coraliomargarita sp. SDUM461003]|uniref:Response regulatory domain-containing protein n=1 Tax=Thalassobacterium maritimum TaxID=3041265 RepID=A0ABU1ARM3_9BACT|nr:hypothetical protein [Coraliomargarita sp. SDUM461003]MDQ8205899.1 hypothetical protein [Coraliomargarita sp. SDUM461003]
MYKVLLIDESDEDMDRFLDYIESQKMSDQLDVVKLLPLSGVDEMLDAIVEERPDAVVVDYKLNDLKTDIDYNVTFNGVDLVEAFLKIKKGFPCFVVTSFDHDAIGNSQDVNIVYSKDLYGRNFTRNAQRDADNRLSLRILRQIEHYHARFAEYKAEYYELLEASRQGDLSATQEERIIELDTFFERSISDAASLPPVIKKRSFQDDLCEFIKKTDELIESVRNSGA